MTSQQHLLELIKAQDILRRVWADCDNMVTDKTLREIDKKLTKIINQLGKLI